MFLKSYFYLLVFCILKISKSDNDFDKRYKAFTNMLDLSYPDQTLLGFGIAHDRFYMFLSTLWLYTGKYDDISISDRGVLQINVRHKSIQKMIDLTQETQLQRALCPNDPHCILSSANVFLYHNSRYKDHGFSFAVLKKSYKHDKFKIFDGKTLKFIAEIQSQTAMPINTIIDENTKDSLSFINKIDEHSYYWIEKQHNLPLIDR